jgi:uncharacterized protein (DUF934 family)
MDCVMRRKKKKKQTDRIGELNQGPAERLSHGIFKVVPTTRQNVSTIRNLASNPIDTYFARNSISPRQHQAANIFASQFHRASLAPAPAAVDLDAVRGGEQSDGAAYRQAKARQAVKQALRAVGMPLADLVEHCAGRGETAGSWSAVADARRPDQEGMVALRLALNGLVRFYRC